MGRADIAERVRSAAAALLAEKQFVASVDVLRGLGWLNSNDYERWRHGRVESLERVTQANLGKITAAMRELRKWASDAGLRPSETAYLARGRDRHPLRFSVGGDPEIERAYRTHWVSPKLSEAAQERLAERQSRPANLLVIVAIRDWICTACAGTGDFLIMEEPGPLCLDCADLGQLEFLPSGDAALTRRARRASTLSAVVLQWSRARKRYERQGILAEPTAIEQAEVSCLADADVRARRRFRDEARRTELDETHLAEFAGVIRDLFPFCPADRVDEIARYTALRGSGRVGRTAAARRLDPNAITLAVRASARHRDSRYDELLMSGLPREDARATARDDVERVLNSWRG